METAGARSEPISTESLPLPIAALLRKAKNSEETKHRHDSAWAAWEASVRLAAAASMPADTAPFALPSLGHWCAVLPRRDDRFDAPELLAAAALLIEVATGKPSRPRSITPTELLAKLAPYRNPEVGHGAPRGPEFYGPAADILLAAVEKAWALGLFWPAGATLLHVGRVEIDAAGARRARLLSVSGLGSTSLGQRPVPDHVLPGRLYLQSGEALSPLHPWIVYQPSDVRERVLFFNGKKRGGADYLDYVSGDHVRSPDLADSSPTLAADLAAIFPDAPAKPAPPAADAPSPRAPADIDAPPPAPAPSRRLRVIVLSAILALAAGAALFVGLRREPAVPRVSADAAVQAELGRALDNYLAADISAAEESFAAVAQRAPEAAFPHLGLALVYGLEEHFEDARTELSRAEKLASGQTDRAAELVRLAHRSDEELGPVLAAFAAYGARRPKDFFAHQIMAYFLTNRGSVEDRIHRFDAALAIDDRHAITYLTKASLLRRLRRWDEAERALSEGLARRPTSSWLLGERALLRMARGDRAAARRDFEEALAHGAPFGAQMTYAALLLNMGDDEARKAEVAVLRRVKRPEDRALFLCHHALALSRRGRAAEAEALFDESNKTARDAARPGTLLRCAILAAKAGDSLRRHAAAKARLSETQAIFASVLPLDAKDAADARRLVTEQRGILHAELGELEEARAAQRELALAKQESVELGHRLALSEQKAVTAPDPDAEAAVLSRVRRRWVQGRLLEHAGKGGEAMIAYRRVADDLAECADADRLADLPCGGYVADALVKRAALSVKAGDAGEAKKAIAALRAFWPDADGDLATMKEAAEIERGLTR